MKRVYSLILSALLMVCCVPVSVSYAQADEELWKKFLRYDLCITDYDAITNEEKELCRFIFETEQASNDTVICERARRTLAHDENIGERITLEQLEAGAYGIWDNYSMFKDGWQTYIHCVPDIIYLDPYTYDQGAGYVVNEYWLDDEGSAYVIFNEKMTPDDVKSFDVFNSDGGLLRNIPAIEMETDPPIRDFRGEAEYMEKFGFIHINGGWYYTKEDGTAVFAWSDYTNSEEDEPITEPFTVESEVNGCPVTAIEHYAFTHAPFTEVILPDTVEVIDGFAFAGCKYLRKIRIPDNMKYIGRFALTAEELVLDTEMIEENIAYDSYFGYSGSIMLKKVAFGENVRTIKANAFNGCEQLESVELSESVRAIGQGAFCNTSVKSVIIPPTVEVIGSLAASKPTEHLSIGDIETHPLTDPPVCAFDSDCVIYGYRGTEAERYAKEWDLEFVELEAQVGDVNLDGTINVADAVALQRFLLGQYVSTGAYYGDMNGDGIVDIFDMILMRRKLIN